MPTVATEEEQLLVALRRGDEQAFATLIDAYSPALLRVAVTYVRTRDVAEEVVQETWLGVIRGLDRFEGRGSLRSWLFTILRNKLVDLARRSPKAHGISLSPFDSGGSQPGFEPAAPGERPNSAE